MHCVTKAARPIGHKSLSNSSANSPKNSGGATLTPSNRKLSKSKLILTLIALSLFLLTAAPESWAQELTATLRIEFLESTRLAPAEVTLEHRPFSDYGLPMADPGFVTPLHVLAEYFEQSYGTGAAAERIGTVSAWGTYFLTSIDGSFGSVAGETNTNWTFAVNQTKPLNQDSGWGYAADQYAVADGDYIDFLGMWGGQWGSVSPWLAFFHSQSYTIGVEQTLEVQLLGLDFFDEDALGVHASNGVSLAGAEILIDPVGEGTTGATTPSAVLTDARGIAELSFDEMGTYLLSAKRPIDSPSSPSGTVSDITRPFALVTVTADGSGTNPPTFDVPAWNSSLGNSHNSGVTGAQTPGTTQSGQALWSHRIGTGAGVHSPVKFGNYIYVAGGTSLFKFNAAAGVAAHNRLVASAQLAAPTGPAVYLAAGSGTIFVPLNGGRVQALDAGNLESLWLSEGFDAGWHSYGALSYSDGYLYGSAGRDRFMVESEGVFFCLNASTGEQVWTYSSTSSQRERGFYWSGAAHITTSTGAALLFAGDDGVLVSHRAGTAGAATTAGGAGTAGAAGSNAAVIDTAPLPGGVRSSVLFVPTGAATDGSTGGIAYVATRDGYLARVVVAADGSFVGSTLAVSLSGAGSTSTPVAYRNRVYVVSGELLEGGYVDVFSASTLQRMRSVQLPGFSQSSPLLSTAGASAANGYEVSLFVALNDARDDVVRIIDSEASGAQMRAHSFFRAGGSFTLSSVSADADGRLYFTDGRGYFTAIAASNAPLPNDGLSGGGNGGSGGNGGGSGGGSNNGAYDPSRNGGSSGSGSDDSTRTANSGPKTGDFSDALPFIIFAALAALVAAAIVAKLVTDSKKEKLEKLAKQQQTKDLKDAVGGVSPAQKDVHGDAAREARPVQKGTSGGKS